MTYDDREWIRDEIDNLRSEIETRAREIAKEEATNTIRSFGDPMKLYIHWRIVENNMKQKEGVRE